MWRLLERDENELHHSGTRVLLARNGRHLFAIQQIGEQSLWNCVV